MELNDFVPQQELTSADFVESPPLTVEASQEKFYTVCKWFRDHHIFAFVIGIPTLGLTYAMAGLGGAGDDDDRAPLTSTWSRGKIKWVSAVSLLCWLGYTCLLIYAAAMSGRAQSWLAIPFLLISVVATLDVIYHFFKEADGFTLGAKHALGARTKPVLGFGIQIERILAKLPEPGQKIGALIWTWMLGLTFVGAFYAAVALATAALIVVLMCAMVWVAILVWAFLSRDSRDYEYVPRPRPVKIPHYPPVCVPSGKAIGPAGDVLVYRKRNELYAKRLLVGFVRQTNYGSEIFTYLLSDGDRLDVFEVTGTGDIIDLESNQKCGSVEGNRLTLRGKAYAVVGD